MLDCDMAPKADILQALLPHCLDVHRAWDPSVALVQSPQAFSNLAPGDPLNNASPVSRWGVCTRWFGVLCRDGILSCTSHTTTTTTTTTTVASHTTQLFYHVLLPGWDSLGAAPCCGTNAVLNRAALKAVGGFAYGSVTEDYLTSLTLQSAGYRTRYVDEVMAEGLAPSSMAPFFAQRLRWAVGGLQIFWRFNPLWGGAFRGGKLTVEQRLLYAWSGGHYLLCFPLAVVLCTPFIFLLDGGGLLLTTGAFALGRGGGVVYDVLIPKLNPTNPTSSPSPPHHTTPHHTTQAPSASTCSTSAPTTSCTRSSPSSRTPASAGARASGTCGARSRSRCTSSSHSSAPPS